MTIHVNSNFLNISRLIFTIGGLFKRKLDTSKFIMSDINVIHQYNIDNQTNMSYIDNDDNYQYLITDNTFKLILKEFFELKKDIDEKNSSNIIQLKPEILELFDKMYNEIIFDKQYLHIINTLDYIKNIKIDILSKKLNESIYLEDYENCATLKKEIDILKNPF